jgi:hypothetical protein
MAHTPLVLWTGGRAKAARVSVDLFGEPRTVENRLAVTGVCLASYLAAPFLPLPGLDLAGLETLPVYSLGRVSVFALDLYPFLAGYLLAELFSFTVPPGQRWRRDGVRGRRKINLLALALGTVVVLLQSIGIALYLTMVTGPYGRAASSAPTALLALTLAAGAFLVFGLAEVVSRFGLGNGFAVLFAGAAPRALMAWLLPTPGGTRHAVPEEQILGLVLSALLVAGAVAFLLRRPGARVATPEGGSLPYRLAPFPQGVPPLLWAYGLLGFLTEPLWTGRGPLVELGWWGYQAGLVAAILGLSALAGWMFSARERIDTNLEGLAVAPADLYGAPWRRQLLLASLLLAGGDAAIWISTSYLLGPDTSLLTLSSILFLAAVILDLRDEARLARTGPLAWVISLDNVHLAEYLQGRLGERGIECVVRGYRFRRLLYVFGPLFKMALLVPEADRDRAVRLVEETPFRIA